MPTRRENETQLERILASKTFEEASRLAPLLKRLVEYELAGKPIDEYTLGIQLFGKPKDWIPMEEATVRQGLANLRQRLHDYYVKEGREDPVLITFRKRQGYRPTFIYNEDSAPVEHYRRGLEAFNRTFPEIIRKAPLSVVRELQLSIRADPSYAPAHAALGEVLLIYTMCDEPYYFSPRERVPEAERAAKTALALNDQLWLAHVVLGAVHSCRFEWAKAAKEFDFALKIAPEETRSHFWYAAFLMAVGKTDEARRSVEHLLKTSPRNEFKPLINSLFLYIRREGVRAYQELIQQSAELDFVKDWTAYQMGEEILECDNWLVETLMACIMLHESTRAAWQYAAAAAKHSKVDAFGGLMVLSYGAMAGLGYEEMGERALKRLALMEREAQHCGPLDMALAYMGVGNKDAAIASLKTACDDAHPLMVWLHLWPVFDPLRDHRNFKKLIKRMKLPV